MSGRIEGVGRRCRTAVGILTLLAALVLALPTVASACIEDGGGEDRGPLIGAAQISPSTFTYQGGTAMVSGEVEDDCGINSVHAEVVSGEGFYSYFELHPVGPGSFVTAILYHGEVQLPPNLQESAVGYQAVIEAEDTNGSIEHAFAGEAEVAGLPPFDEAPYVSSPVIGPRDLPASGGSVKIRATATDNRSVSVVYATVTLPDGSTIEVPMEPISCCEFEGVLTVPPNTSVTPQHYSIEIIAQDDIGQPGSIDAGLVTVAAALPPPTSHLMVEPDSLSFGSVRIGRQAGQFLLLENTGPKSSGQVQGVIVTSGAPFSLAGGKPSSAPFRLRPGQSKRYRIRFRPRTLGDQSGTAKILSSDQVQPEIVVPLSGQGVCRCPTRPR